MLNKGQNEAKELILEFVKNKLGIFGLLGAGGCGKTYLITSLNDSENYQYLAPTNKAVNLLRSGLIKNGCINPKVKTIDSFFKLRMKKDENNKTIFTYDQPIKDFPDVIVVDECSMLTFKHLELLTNMNKKIPIIMLGDDMQLPPVEEPDAKIFIDDDGFKKSLVFNAMEQTYTLTEQNRQNKDSELYQLINGFRNNMHINMCPRKLSTKKNNEIDILYYQQNSKDLNDFIKDNESFAVCFKNNTSDYFNYKIGSIKTGTKNYNIKDVNEGEFLMFNSFYCREKITFYSSELIEVKKVFDEDVEIKIDVIDKIIIAEQTKAIVKNERGIDKIIWLRNTDLMNKIWRVIYQSKKKTNDPKILSELNTFYNDFKNGFANLKKPYSLTTHKSQGSTFENVIIPIYDFWKKDYKDANQLLYVAMSRASKKIVFVDGFCNFKNDSKRRLFTEEERCLLASLNNWKCKNCGVDLHDGKYDIDHINYLGYIDNKGELKGNNSIENLQALCKECHKLKTKQDYEKRK
jgi:hypothetical protein